MSVGGRRERARKRKGREGKKEKRKGQFSGASATGRGRGKAETCVYLNTWALGGEPATGPCSASCELSELSEHHVPRQSFLFLFLACSFSFFVSPFLTRCPLPVTRPGKTESDNHLHVTPVRPGSPPHSLLFPSIPSSGSYPFTLHSYMLIVKLVQIINALSL